MEIEAAYMAGVADSDGCFGITKRKCKSTITGYSYDSVFQLTWKQCETSVKIIELMQAKYGGSVHKHQRGVNNYKPSSIFIKYSIHSSNLIRFIKDLLPYLKLKKEQAKLALKLAEGRDHWRKNHKGKGRAKPLRLWKIADKLYEKSRELKGHKRRDFSIEKRTV